VPAPPPGWKPAGEERGLLTPGLRRWGRIIGFSLLLAVVVLAREGNSTSAAATAPLEDLHYRVKVLIWPDAVRVRVTLKRLGPGKFVAEAVGEPRGLIKLLTGDRRERLQTVMVWRGHRLQPSVYREESWRQGRRSLKEYRFHYDQGRLEMWQRVNNGKPVKKWQTALEQPVYDPLSAVYNCRLQLMGPTRAGETVTIRGIPYPRPEALEVSLGPMTKTGRQAMVTMTSSVFKESRGAVFGWLDKRMVPLRVRTTVSGLNVQARLMPRSVVMPPVLPGVSRPGTPPPEKISPQ
jgi:hypothetical protein